MGDRLGIVTNGGGAGILAVDAMEGLPGRLAQLAPATLAALDMALPATWSCGNPVDVIGDAGPERYRAAIAAMLADPGIDALLVMHCPTAIADAGAIAALIDEFQATTAKPILGCWLGETNARRARDTLAKAAPAGGAPVLFSAPEDAIRAFSYLVQASHAADQGPPIRHAASGESAARVLAARSLIAAVRADGRTVLSEPEAKALLAGFGIPVARAVAVATPEAVEAACASIDPPYVVKIVSPDLTHKSDIGGVALGLADPHAAREAAQAMLAHVTAIRPQARLQGFSVQALVRRKQAHELFAGFTTDPAFGPLLMVGAGGTAIEVLADRAIRLPPLDRGTAEAMLAETRISALLAGYRDVPATHREAIVEVVLALADLCRQVPGIAECEVNPLLADAEGVIALDARVLLAPEPPARTRR
jgi:acetyltransferase